VTFLLAGIGYFGVRQDINELRAADHETILWSAVQVELELARFEHVLEGVIEREPEATNQYVNERFDILWSRISLFDQGSVGTRLRKYDQPGQVVAKLFSLMKRLEPEIVGLKADDKKAALRLTREFSPFGAKLHVLSLAVLHGEENIRAGYREALSKSSSTMLVISVMAVFASLLMIVVFARESNRFRHLAELNQTLLDRETKAGRAKSQFLAMMSHELRTPLNGVLGLLALVRQVGVNDQQTRLIDQAERSGQQMTSLLEDILDYSAIQDGVMTVENRPFVLGELVDAVRDMFMPRAAREGISFTVNLNKNSAHRIMGDSSRLRQAVNHLATYLLETAGTRDIVLDVNHENGELKASISFDYNQTGGDWTPDLIVGKLDATDESFATEALGPAIARSLILRMGGRTALEKLAPGRVAIVVSVPSKDLVVRCLLVQLMCNSASLETICKAALAPENVQFLTESSLQDPNVIMIEAGGSKEAQTVDICGKTYPQALLVALGRPHNPDDFFDIVDVPIDMVAIRKSRFLQLLDDGSKLARGEKLDYQGEQFSTLS